MSKYRFFVASVTNILLLTFSDVISAIIKHGSLQNQTWSRTELNISIITDCARRFIKECHSSSFGIRLFAFSSFSSHLSDPSEAVGVRRHADTLSPWTECTTANTFHSPLECWCSTLTSSSFSKMAICQIHEHIKVVKDIVMQFSDG